MPMVAAGPAPSSTLNSTAADWKVTQPIMHMAAPVMMNDGYAKDSLINWFKGEFAAANAIIDVLCGHLIQLARASPGGVTEYESVFMALHQRRLNWLPVLQMQKYHSISDLTVELKKVAAKKAEKEKSTEEVMTKDAGCLVTVKIEEKMEERVVEVQGKESLTAVTNNGGGDVEEEENVVDGGDVEDDSPTSDITHAGSQDEQKPPIENSDICSENTDICLNHEECEGRASQIKLTKGFTAKEQVRGHMVNVVKGLKMYEDIFSDVELSKLTDFVTEMRAAGQNGELAGDTFVLFNKQEKGNKRELIQFGVPVFGRIQDETEGFNIEPIPELLESVIDHLIQWRLLPEFKRPNGCVVNFFDEDEYSQPILKPPHWDQPIATLLLSESTMAYGRILTRDNEGNYRGPIMLSLKQGSLLVMRGNSADMARHVMCPSPNKRVTITLVRVRPDAYQVQSPPTSPSHNAMTVWQPAAFSNHFAMPINGAVLPNSHEATTMDMVPKWGVVPLMFAPTRTMVMSPRKLPRGGTGVFLPWHMNSRKPTKHLPPRAQKGRLLALTSQIDQRHTIESTVTKPAAGTSSSEGDSP